MIEPNAAIHEVGLLIPMNLLAESDPNRSLALPFVPAPVELIGHLNSSSNGLPSLSA
ncbi:hypothetical protein [Novosphingobium taihuense]|uniref:Uncharacterized protein n=1 Tax=Novosphingobium taihuense TaxID=260085 RepID=A0A7W7AA89_9SPHN|nr:hypothetical protein [Novosphingobium taihuense]MBB4612659.1 hypothetical protein [Novosphingobium taihuense]